MHVSLLWTKDIFATYSEGLVKTVVNHSQYLFLVSLYIQTKLVNQGSYEMCSDEWKMNWSLSAEQKRSSDSIHTSKERNKEL